MKSRRTKEFREMFDALPQSVQNQAKRAYQRFKRNTSHPGLQFKPVDTETHLYSVRIGTHYRALGIWRGNAILWFWIGTHAEYDKFIAQW